MEARTAQPEFWEDREQAQQILQELTALRECLDAFGALEQRLAEVRALWELSWEEGNQELAAEIAAEVRRLERELEDMTLDVLLSGPYDDRNAILSLHAGAGGTDAQDWVEMLLRMYLRWAEKRGYKTVITELMAGEEAGLKSATVMISGHNVYGYLKSEKGVHRLVRVSPYDFSGRRHTSFAAVDVLPEISDEIEVAIDPNDLRIDTYRSGGAGGQHVNKTDSAVRITHLPTGIVVACQNERSQQMNRLVAMKILRSRLFELERRQQEQALAELRGEQMDIAWGSQIRSYTFHPFSLVKDHRTGFEVGNVQGVMDGDLDDLISAYLQQEAARKSQQPGLTGTKA